MRKKKTKEVENVLIETETQEKFDLNMNTAESEKKEPETETETKKDYQKEYKKRKAEAEFIESLNGIGSLIGNLIIDRLPNKIPLTETEQKQLDIVTAKLMFKYSSYYSKFSEELNFVLVFGMIIIPRIKKSE